MRVALFVDGSNFFYMQKEDLHWWVDPKRLIEYAQTKGELVDAYYYVGKGIPSEARQDNYLKALTYIGYSLVTKDLKTILQEDGTYKQKANLDIEIVLDMFNTIDNYDLAILVSGDGDFERALQLLRARGKKFIILCTQKFIARELREVAGMHFVDLRDIKEQVEKIH